MYWQITKDYLVDGEYIKVSRVGTRYMSYAREREHPTQLESCLKIRLLDDDGELYYEAIADDEALENLFDWAMTDAGCTLLQVFENGEWVDTIG